MVNYGWNSMVQWKSWTTQTVCVHCWHSNRLDGLPKICTELRDTSLTRSMPIGICLIHLILWMLSKFACFFLAKRNFTSSTANGPNSSNAPTSIHTTSTWKKIRTNSNVTNAVKVQMNLQRIHREKYCPNWTVWKWARSGACQYKKYESGCYICVCGLK